MGEPFSEAAELVDVPDTFRRGNLVTDEGHNLLLAQLETEITNAGYEAAMTDAPIEAALAATLFLRSRYINTDPAVADHFLRMAAMRAKFPFTPKENDRLEKLAGGAGVIDLALACMQLECLARDVADPHGFPTVWFEAWLDLSVAMREDAWPQR